MHEALAAGGRQEDGKRQFLAEQGDLGIELGDIHQDARLEPEVLVGFVVPAQGEFVGGATRDACPGAMRDTLFGGRFVIEKGKQLIQIGSGHGLSGGLRAQRTAGCGGSQSRRQQVAARDGHARNYNVLLKSAGNQYPPPGFITKEGVVETWFLTDK